MELNLWSRANHYLNLLQALLFLILPCTLGHSWYVSCPASVYPFLFWVLLLFIVKDREAWRIAVHGGAKNQTQFSD